jgi:DNA-binding HxlR family transcriptional regulator
VEVKGHKLKGINFFDKAEQRLMRSLLRPEFNLKGMRRADLRPFLPSMSAASITRQLWRMRKLGVIKKIAGTYRYYLTKIGRSVIAACCRLTEQTIVQTLA